MQKRIAFHSTCDSCLTSYQSCEEKEIFVYTCQNHGDFCRECGIVFEDTVVCPICGHPVVKRKSKKLTDFLALRGDIIERSVSSGFSLGGFIFNSLCRMY